MKNTQRLNFLISFKFFFLIMLIILIFFNYLDIYIFKLTRSLHGLFFSFFNNVIDPISDILDPLNIIILCALILFFNFNIQSVLRNETKLNVIKSKTKFSYNKIINVFEFSSLLSKHFILSLAIAGIACNILKYFFGVSRPKYFFLEGYERINFFNLEHKVSSFPSGHTQAAFTVAILLMIYVNRYTIFFLALAILMGLSRIFLSMHFPSDLIAGAYLGSLVPLLLYNEIFKKRIEAIRKKYNLSFFDFVKIMYWRIFI